MITHFFPAAKKCLLVSLILAALLAPRTATPQQLPEVEIYVPKENEKWIQIQTENFTIYGNAREKIARLTGANLERLRKTLILLADVTAINTPVPTLIFLFKDDKSFKPYNLRVHGRPAALAGYFLPRPDGNYIALSAQHGASQIIYHEYLHFFVNNNLPNVPLWFNEGLAEYYSTFESDEDEAKIGVPAQHHLALLKSARLLPLDQLFAVAERAIFYDEDTRQGIFYAQSWLLVHYFMQGREGKLRPQLSQFLALLAQGHPQNEAFDEAFEVSQAQLQKALENYLRQYLFSYTRIGSKGLAVATQARVTPMPYEEVLFYLGDLLAHQDKERLPEAEAHLRHAISVNPDYARAYAGLGFIEKERGNIAEARRNFEQAIALGPPHSLTQYQYGNCLMTGIKSRVTVNYRDPAVQAAALEARAAFRAAIALDQNFVEAHAAFGETFVFDPHSPPEEGIAALDFALKRLPSHMEIAVNLLTLCARSGDTTVVQILLERLIAARGNSGLVAEARARVVKAALERAAQMVEEKNVEAALQMLDWAQSISKDAHQLALIDKTRQAAQHEQHVSLYQRAVIRATNKEFDDALDLLKQVIATCEEAELQESASHSIRQVRHNQQVEWYNQAVTLVNNNRHKQAVPLLNRIVAAPIDPKLAQSAKDALKYIREFQRQKN